VAVPVEPPVPPRPARILPPDPQLQPEPTPEPTPQAPAPPAATTPPVAPIPAAPVPVPGLPGGPAFDPLTSPDLAVTPVHSRAPEDTGDNDAGGTPPPATESDAPRTPASTAVARLGFSSGAV